MRQRTDGTLVEPTDDLALMGALATASTAEGGQRVLILHWGESLSFSSLIHKIWKSDSVVTIDLASDYAVGDDLPESSVEVFDTVILLGKSAQLKDPGRLRTLRKTGAISSRLMVMCTNPNSMRLDSELRNSLESSLGRCDLWFVGVPVRGFTNVSDVSASHELTDLPIRVVASDSAGDPVASAYAVGVWDRSGEHLETPPGLVTTLGPAGTHEFTSVGEGLKKAEREIGRLHLRLRAAEEELYLIRDSAELMAESRLVEFREALQNQARMIDERDEYIVTLEERMRQMTEATGWLTSRPRLQRSVQALVALRRGAGRKPPQ